MIKTNSIFLVCITLFLVIPVKFTYAQEKLFQESASIGKKGLNNPLVDTGQVRCFDNSREILYPKPGQPFYGQDAQYEGNVPSYQDNADGTITDLNTGLMWLKAVDKMKVSLIEAKKIAQRMTLGGYSDWRVPNIKELYSLIDFRGYTGYSRGGFSSGAPTNAIPFINTDYFDFEYGDVSGGGRELLAERLQPFLQGRSGGHLHVTGVQGNGAAYRVQGYIEGSALGELRLPDGLHIVKENGVWKWQGIVDSKQTE